MEEYQLDIGVEMTACCVSRLRIKQQVLPINANRKNAKFDFVSVQHFATSDVGPITAISSNGIPLPLLSNTIEIFLEPDEEQMDRRLKHRILLHNDLKGVNVPQKDP